MTATITTPATTTPATTTPATIDPKNPIVMIGWSTARAERALAETTANAVEIIKDMTAAGHEQEIMRRWYITSHMACTLSGKGAAPSTNALTVAEKVLAMPGKDREKVQTDAYNAARMAWSRVLAKAGLTSNHGNAANANAASADNGRQNAGQGKTKDAAPTTQEALVESLPVAKTVKAGRAFLTQTLATMKGHAAKYPAAYDTAMLALIAQFEQGLAKLPPLGE